MIKHTSIFIDTSYLTAFFIPPDPKHRKAKELLEEIAKADYLYISNLIFSETMTILSRQLNKHHMKPIMSFLDALSFKELIIDTSIHKRSKKEFERISNKDISFVDVSTAILMKHHDIDQIITFEQSFQDLAEHHHLTIID